MDLKIAIFIIIMQQNQPKQKIKKDIAINLSNNNPFDHHPEVHKPGRCTRCTKTHIDNSNEGAQKYYNVKPPLLSTNINPHNSDQQKEYPTKNQLTQIHHQLEQKKLYKIYQLNEDIQDKIKRSTEKLNEKEKLNKSDEDKSALLKTLR